MLNRLGVRQKLGLLILLPLAAVVFTIIPFAVDRVDTARGEAAAASIAATARQTGWLVQDLQRERLAAIAYLALTTVDRSEVLRRFQDVDSDVGPAGDRLRNGLDLPASLGPLRQAILARSIEAASAYQRYHDIIESLFDGLHLSQPDGVDSAGLLGLIRLDATLRANEVASQVGAALVISAGADAAGPALLAAAGIDAQAEDGRLARSQTPDGRAAWAALVSGPAGQRAQALTRLYSGPSLVDNPAAAASALATAQSYDALRQNAQDAIAADIVGQSSARAGRSRLTAALVASIAAVILLFITTLSVRVSRSVASPLRRLTRAATAIADLAGAELVRVADEDDIGDPPRLAAVDLRSEDEVGELATAFNRVQATAALLLERQVTMRRNVAVMFANIGRRTHSLVARQLAVIDDMERNEQDALLLERLYRLDHLTTRLRRSAESLLVVAGSQDNSQAAPTALLDVVRGAMAEIPGFQAIRLGAVPDVVIAADLAIDLRLLVAEVLENATSFSPPGSVVEVDALRQQSVQLRITDHGIGMTGARLAEENQRMVERQRLDVVPTQVLGLFVVGRLARRHGLEVRLGPTPVQGVTVTVTVPPNLFTVPAEREPRVVAVAAVAGPSARAIGAASPAEPAWRPPGQSGDGNFSWLPDGGHRHGPVPSGQPRGSDAPYATTPSDGQESESRNGFTRRRPGHHFPSFVGPNPSSPARSTVERDPRAEAAQLEAFAQGGAAADADFRGGTARPPAPAPGHDLARHRLESAGARPAPARATAAVPTHRQPTPGDPSRGGLTQRVPGAQLADSARTRPRAAPSGPAGTTPDRDSAAERDALNDFVAGLARAHRTTEHDHR